MLSVEIKKQVSVSVTLGSNSENYTFEEEFQASSEEEFSNKIDKFVRSKVIVAETDVAGTIRVTAKIADSDLEKSISISQPISRQELDEVISNWIDRLINYSVTIS